tara:strand:+ start:238 stop:414 length:177 start_codon:yes stop_codon:yes gene_type:complete
MISIKELEALTLTEVLEQMDEVEMLVDNTTDFRDILKLQEIVSRNLTGVARKRAELKE